MADVSERRFGALTVRIDREACITTENCIETAPGVFHVGDDSLCAFVETATPTGGDLLVEACKACPVQALTLLDGDGTQLVP